MSNENHEQKEEKKILSTTDILTPLSIILASLIIAFSIVYGLGQVSLITGSADSDDLTAAQQIEEGQIKEITVSVDDDPILGNINDTEKVIVEFSDYQCPYCERFFSQTLPEIKSEYVDSGKVAMVFRDLPLGIHDPIATQKAAIAECVRSKTDDEQYFAFHDFLFENFDTKDPVEIVAKVTDFNLNPNEIQSCATSEETIQEIKNDIKSANELGITGTPGFVIGTYNAEDKTVTGPFINGAQPYEIFKQVIEL